MFKRTGITKELDYPVFAKEYYGDPNEENYNKQLYGKQNQKSKRKETKRTTRI